MQRAWRVVTPLLLALVILGAQTAAPGSSPAKASGGQPRIRPGTAITDTGWQGQIMWFLPGQPFVYNEIYLRNESARPLTIQSIELRGDGSPEVVDMLRRSMAPLDHDPETGKYNTTPDGIWMSYPPTMHLYDDVPCTVQHVEPVRGFVLEPGASARLIVVMRTMKVGQVHIVDDRVVYRQNGRLYGQNLHNEFTVHVRTPGWVFKPTKHERECRSLGNILPFD